MNKPTIPFVETMLTQVCNLSCLGCTNYSDLPGRQGYITWQDGKQQLNSWLQRVHIPDFGLMGGEPLINPEWRQWLYGVRELMPDSQIRFTTNGLLLKKYPNIIDEMFAVGNVVFKITQHTQDVKLYVDEIFQKYTWESVVESGIKRWKAHNAVRFQVNCPSTFVKTYRNNYNNMMPWNSQPEKAFEQCCQQTCPLLYKGRIYKCSTSGLLKDTLNFNGITAKEWEPYIDDGISAEDSDDKILKFIENFGKPAQICAMCPQSGAGLISHSENVVVR